MAARGTLASNTYIAEIIGALARVTLTLWRLELVLLQLVMQISWSLEGLLLMLIPWQLGI